MNYWKKFDKDSFRANNQNWRPFFRKGQLTTNFRPIAGLSESLFGDAGDKPVPFAFSLSQRGKLLMRSRAPSVFDPNFLGKLALLNEAAGKVRVIAVVDPLTQWALRPLHKWLMAILSKIPQDGTFDQYQPIQRLNSLVRKSKDKFVGSADMSAATDRLPVSLQERLLSYKLGKDFAKA